MAFDRYMSCVHPCKYRILITRKVTLTIIFLQWIVSLGLLAIETTYNSNRTQIKAYFRASMGLLFVIIGAIMYGRTACVLKKNSRYFTTMAAVSNTAQNMTQNARMKQEKRLFTTMFLVSFVTIITMVPLAIYVILQGRTNNINSDPVHMWFSTLLFVNFSINPFVYLWRLKNYRKTFKIVFKNMGGCCLRKTFEPSQEQRRI
jgi:hypothetical protein